MEANQIPQQTKPFPKKILILGLVIALIAVFLLIFVLLPKPQDPRSHAEINIPQDGKSYLGSAATAVISDEISISSPISGAMSPTHLK